MHEYIDEQGRGLVDLLKNIIKRKEIYFFTYIFLFLINIYLFRKVQFLQNTTVEFIPSESSASEIYAEISGAVNAPGVYKLNSGAMLKDLVTKGGGLSENVNSDFVMKNLNLASKINPQEKTYIPYVWDKDFILFHDNFTKIDKLSSDISSANVDAGENSVTDFNSLTFEYLVSIKGIGETYAQKILDNMPYDSNDDFISRSKIPKSLAEKVIINMTSND